MRNRVKIPWGIKPIRDRCGEVKIQLSWLKTGFEESFMHSYKGRSAQDTRKHMRVSQNSAVEIKASGVRVPVNCESCDEFNHLEFVCESGLWKSHLYDYTFSDIIAK